MADVIPAALVPYIDIADVRSAGIPESEADDATVLLKIKLWSDLVDKWTRQFFNRRDLEITLEGKNSNILLLGIPLIEVDSIRLNHFLPRAAGEVLDLTLVQSFIGRTSPVDDRRNPRIKILVNSRSIFSTVGRTFRRGLLSTITGKFGFLETDGTTPEAIKRSVLKLVLKDIRNPLLSDVSGTSGSGSTTLGAKKREETDLHEIEYFQPSAEVLKSMERSISGDAEVDRLLSYYRSPISIGGSILDIPTVDDGVTL